MRGMLSLSATNPASPMSRWLPPVCWATLVLTLSLLPEVFFFGATATPEARRLHYYLEVLVHIFQSCVFFLLMIRALRSAGRSRITVLTGAFVAVLLLSLVNESVQAFTPTRMFDVIDMTMDALGGIVGLGLARAGNAI